MVTLSTRNTLRSALFPDSHVSLPNGLDEVCGTTERQVSCQLYDRFNLESFIFQQRGYAITDSAPDPNNEIELNTLNEINPTRSDFRSDGDGAWQEVDLCDMEKVWEAKLT